MSAATETTRTASLSFPTGRRTGERGFSAAFGPVSSADFGFELLSMYIIVEPVLKRFWSVYFTIDQRFGLNSVVSAQQKCKTPHYERLCCYYVVKFMSGECGYY